MSKVRVNNFTVSLDGFGTGEFQTLDAPFGHAGERLHEWMFATGFWHQMIGHGVGTNGVDDAFARRYEPPVGAEIMGAGKYGYPGWHHDPDWKGWWGHNPPFHTPVFVLTHHIRPPIEMDGGTVFNFIDATPTEALAAARAEVGELDIRIGGGPTVVRDFLAAGLVDDAHIVVAPIVLGRGVRVWDGLEALEQKYDIEAIASPSRVTHLTLTKI